MKKPHGLQGRPGNRLGTGAGPSTTLSVRLPVSVREALDRTAAEQGTTVNRLAVEALRRASGL